MNKLKCYFCGKIFRKVCAHVYLAHGIEAREYKEMMGYDVKKGIIDDAQRDLLRWHALENGMDKKLKQWGEVSRIKKGQKLPYKRSTETIARLKVHGKNLPHAQNKYIQPRKCLFCGAEFTPSYNKAKYCGSKCYHKAYPKIRKSIGA